MTINFGDQLMKFGELIGKCNVFGELVVFGECEFWRMTFF